MEKEYAEYMYQRLSADTAIRLIRSFPLRTVEQEVLIDGLNHVAASCLIRMHFDKAASMLAVNGELDIDLIQEEVNKELPALLSEPLRAVGMEYRFTETDVQNLFAKLRQYGSKENG